MKESTPYFSHDLGARNDPKLIQLQMEMGGVGLGIYWCLVEMLWENGGMLPKNYKNLAFSLRWAKELQVKRVVEDFELFQFSDETFFSPSAMRRIAARQRVSDAKRKAGVESGVARNSARKSPAADPPESGTSDEHVLNKNGTDGAQALSKDSTDDEHPFINKINKENKINKINSSSSFVEQEEEKEKVLSIFFFEKNFAQPLKELERFWNYYEGCGWKWRDDRPIENIEAVARQWKPENEGTHFDRDFLDWYSMIYSCVLKGAAGIDPHSLMVQLLSVSRTGHNLILIYNNQQTAAALSSFVSENKLAGEWQLQWKFKQAS